MRCSRYTQIYSMYSVYSNIDDLLGYKRRTRYTRIYAMNSIYSDIVDVLKILEYNRIYSDIVDAFDILNTIQYIHTIQSYVRTEFLRRHFDSFPCGGILSRKSEIKCPGFLCPEIFCRCNTLAGDILSGDILSGDFLSQYLVGRLLKFVGV